MIVDFDLVARTAIVLSHKTVRLGGAESHSTISRWDWDREMTQRMASGWKVEFWDMIQTNRNPMSGAC